MQVVTSREGAVTVLKPLGPIIIGELDELDSQLQELARKWTKRIVINMSVATFIDSAGLELLDRHYQRLSENGLEIKLSNVNEISLKILELTRISNDFEIYCDTAAAARSFL